MAIQSKRSKNDMRRKNKSFEYDVCLSFASEERIFVREVANELKNRGVRVFFDEYAEAELWGKDLYSHLDDIYRNAAHYCVLFASKNYANRVWTNHERQSAQARALTENKEYILPARFDDTPIPGLRTTVGYIDLRSRTAESIAELVVKKLGPRQHTSYFPPVPDRLFSALHLRSRKSKQQAEFRARDFFTALLRMNPEERDTVFALFLNSCPAELPDNVHISLDLLRRVTNRPAGQIKRILANLRSLGFYVNYRQEAHDTNLKEEIVVLEWHDMTTDDSVGGNATETVDAMLRTATSEYCETHGRELLARLDFSQLASVTASNDNHQHDNAATERVVPPDRRGKALASR
jgi:hypothetical protein